MKKNQLTRLGWAFVFAGALVTLGATSASAENPTVPVFQCSVTFPSRDKPVASVKHTGGGAVDPKHDVIAVVNTPSGKKDYSLCGSQLASGGTATVSVSTTEKAGFLFTCTAYQGTTTFACNPVR
jgi:hypothetical protein